MFGRRRREGAFSWQSLLLGLAIGAALALVLSPYSGKHLRSKLLQAVERARTEVRGTERYGGGEHADPLEAVKRRWNEAMAAEVDAVFDGRVPPGCELPVPCCVLRDGGPRPAVALRA